MDSSRYQFGSEQGVCPVCSCTASNSTDAKLYGLVRSEIPVCIYILGSNFFQIEGQRFVFEPLHRVLLTVAICLGIRAFPVIESCRGGVSVGIARAVTISLACPIVCSDTIIIKICYNVEVCIASTGPSQELGIWPVNVILRIGSTLGSLGGVIAEVEQLVILVPYFNIKLWIRYHDAATATAAGSRIHDDTMGARA